MKIFVVGATFFHADRQTDIMKLIVAFRNLTNTPKKADFFSTHQVFTFHIFLIQR